MRLLSLCPRVRKDAGQIVVTTAWRLRLLSGGTIFRRVAIDPAQACLSIESRYCWLIGRQRTIPFCDVRAVTYGYEDFMDEASVFSYAHDGLDWFTVGLRLRDDSELRLFNFIGDGSFTNHGPFPDWVYFQDYVVDITGSQEKESRVFVDVLSNLIGVEVVPPRNV